MRLHDAKSEPCTCYLLSSFPLETKWLSLSFLSRLSLSSPPLYLSCSELLMNFLLTSNTVKRDVSRFWAMISFYAETNCHTYRSEKRSNSSSPRIGTPPPPPKRSMLAINMDRRTYNNKFLEHGNCDWGNFFHRGRGRHIASHAPGACRSISPQTKQLTLRPWQLHCSLGHSRGWWRRRRERRTILCICMFVYFIFYV